MCIPSGPTFYHLCGHPPFSVFICFEHILACIGWAAFFLYFEYFDSVQGIGRKGSG